LEQAVKKQSGNLDRLSVDLLQAMEALDSASQAFRRTADRADRATRSDELTRTVRDAEASAAALREAAGTVRDLAAALSAEQGSLRSVTARADTVLARLTAAEGTLGLLVKDPALYRHSDSLVLELRGLVADLKANPRKYVNLKVF
jgi:phospholipid/cholesterol/gamma-HCH transport system substrate-binding protein